MNTSIRKEYNDLFNEGGEGYNPYPKKRAAIPQWVILSNVRDRILRVIAGVSINDPRYTELTAELAAVEIKLAAAKK